MNKKIQIEDPHAEREAGKYDQPIPSREFILQYLSDSGQLQKLQQLAEALELSEEQDMEALRRRLRAMERDGQLICNRRGAYGVAAKMDLIRGRVIGHPDGFGFVVPDEGGDDLFLSARQMQTLFHGDRALVQVTGVDRRGRREGAVVEVLEHNTHQLVGRFFSDASIPYVVPDNRRITQNILIPAASQNAAGHGEIVVVEIVASPTRRGQAVGQIVEVLGQHMAPGMEIEVAVRNYQLPFQWSLAVEQEALQFGAEVPETAKQGRVDIRAVPLVTIDGEDSRDFDDAVFCERHEDGWRLLVAIADVSSYVQPNTALDQEAQQRGNSVYFPQQVIPMLPEVLSNQLCSLNPDVDRLCLVCEMVFSASGEMVRHGFFEGVMRSHARLTYNQVAAMLIDNDADLCQQFATLLPNLQDIQTLYHLLRVARDQRGAIDFDRTETRIVFGEQRKIDRIVPVVRNDAHKMIEEFMISANVAAAEFLTAKKMPLVYRVHEAPGLEKLTDVRSFMAELGLQLGGGDEPQAKDYKRLINEVSERPDRHLIETVLLRSLRQAMYSPDNTGHFGLALAAYAHFTSPIRRYPDLLVHRAIRHVLTGGNAATFAYNHADMEVLGEQSSMTERRADEATRDVVDWLKCEYMLAHVGSDFDGIVTTVTGFGLFVELQDIFVEGLIHVTELDNDYYHFDPVGHRLTGERSGRSYCVGDPIRVTVARVDLDDRKIDFVLPGASMAGGEKSGVARKGGKKPRGSATKTVAAGEEKSAATKKKRRRSKKKKE
jgi:ribonuclease R